MINRTTPQLAVKRIPRDEDPFGDFSSPLDLEKYGILNNTSCFGRLYFPLTPECAICKACISCAIIMDQIKTPADRLIIKARKGTKFLDEYNFRDPRLEKIGPTVKENPDEFTYEEIFETVGYLTRCDNPDLIHDYIESMNIQYGLDIQKTDICSKE